MPFWAQQMILKIKPKRVQLFPSNWTDPRTKLKNIYGKAEISSTKQHKIHKESIVQYLCLRSVWAEKKNLFLRWIFFQSPEWVLQSLCSIEWRLVNWNKSFCTRCSFTDLFPGPSNLYAWCPSKVNSEEDNKSRSMGSQPPFFITSIAQQTL